MLILYTDQIAKNLLQCWNFKKIHYQYISCRKHGVRWQRTVSMNGLILYTYILHFQGDFWPLIYI